MIGEGPIDLASEIQVLRDIGYEGAISLELFNAELWAQDPSRVLKTGIEHLRELVHES
jgi:sugar phosphate isomerase/epimerase